MSAACKACGTPRREEAAGKPPVILDSRDLVGERGEVLIRHEGRIYRLSRTRQGKLILTA